MTHPHPPSGAKDVSREDFVSVMSRVSFSMRPYIPLIRKRNCDPRLEKFEPLFTPWAHFASSVRRHSHAGCIVFVPVQQPIAHSHGAYSLTSFARFILSHLSLSPFQIPFSVPSEPVSRLVFLLAITTSVCVSSTVFLLFQVGNLLISPNYKMQNWKPSIWPRKSSALCIFVALL